MLHEMQKKQDVLECHQTDKTIFICIDLQKVLLSPSLNASAIYYLKKLCSYNYTVYDEKNHQAMCYIWSECATELSSNTFGCLIYDYLSSNERCKTADSITIYSDGCAYQNRCTQLSNVLLLFAKMYQNVVLQKFLVQGHTQMEVDSVHTLIERTIRKKGIYSPACYIPLIRMAMKKDPTYTVKYIDHTF